MARRTITDMSAWPSLTLEGNLIAPAMVAQVYAYNAPEQSEEHYRIRKGLTLREEISTAFRVGQSHFDAFAKLDHPSAEATRRFFRAFLTETFGFDDLAPGDGAIAFIAGGRVPVVVVPPSEEKLDRRSPTLSIDRSRSPAFALQDYLNDHDVALWGLVTNGLQVRLMRDNASLTRPAYIEADLGQIFTNEDAASFAVLWLLIHRTRFGVAGAPATDCALERWRDAGSREGEAAREKLAVQVEKALKLLGSGFLEANPDLAARLKSGEVNLTEWFNELLRLVYRLIFLMVAEDRNLLHPENVSADSRKLYAEGYSLTHLRTQCFRAATWDKHHDRFEGIKVVFRALTHGAPALGLPALGGLFAEDRLPHLETARLRNRAFMEALFRLSWLSEKSGMVPVNWRAMETEELGSVYESLLELQPQLGADGKSLLFATEAAEQKGNQRKITGSYYTPDSLVQALLDTALDPVLDKTASAADDPAEALLKLSVIDPACGSGHFLLAAARRIATRLARIRAEGIPSLGDFRHALRDVARSCIHGVDRNPMAVELTKVALWIETVDPGLPLGFFDAQIRCGDALLGVLDLKVLQDGIPDAAYKPLTGDDKDIAKYYLKANRDATAGQGGFDFGTGQASMPAMKPLALDFSGFRDLPEDTVEQIDAKAKRFNELRKGQTFVRAKAAADLYLSAFLLPKVGGAPAGASARTVPTTEELWLALNQGKMREAMMDAPRAARSAHAFHWPLEFPDVMQRGGFDVVLGNPPWEKIKLEEKEFFAARSPEIANAPNKAARDRLIKALEKAAPGTADRALFDAFARAKREAEATSEFVRVPSEDGGRFALTGRGDVNTYALFAELCANLARRRAGVIVPTGIATDATTAPFFAHLVEEKRLARLVDFENREGIFPAVHRSYKFCLLTLGRQENTARFTCFLHDAGQINDTRRMFNLTKVELETLSPITLTAPVYRTSHDKEISYKIARFARTFSNNWNFKLKQGLFHSSNDSRIFEGSPGDGYIPLYEPRMLHQYDHRYTTYCADRWAGAEAFKANPNWEPFPRYYVKKDELELRLGRKDGYNLSYRRVSRNTDERTIISAIIPTFSINENGVIVDFLDTSAENHAIVESILNCLVCDYQIRQKDCFSLSNSDVMSLSVLARSAISTRGIQFIMERVLELTYTSDSLAPFARDLGYDGPPFAWDEDRRAALRADLDAFYARAYDLTRDELRYILEPADVKGPDYPSETFRVLKDKEIRQYGEYRTRRLVLEAWDRMEADGTFVNLGLGSGQIADTAPTIQSPFFATLPDGAWMRGAQQPNDAGAALTAILKTIDGPTPSRTVRLAVALMLEPHLLTSLLPAARAQEWRRLVGQEAEPRAGNVVGFAARTNQGWGTAVSNHRGNGRLIENLSVGTWGPGPGLDAFDTAGWPDGRAGFVLEALSSLDLVAAITSMPDEVRGWITHVAAA